MMLSQADRHLYITGNNAEERFPVSFQINRLASEPAVYHYYNGLDHTGAIVSLGVKEAILCQVLVNKITRMKPLYL